MTPIRQLFPQGSWTGADAPLYAVFCFLAAMALQFLEVCDSTCTYHQHDKAQGMLTKNGALLPRASDDMYLCGFGLLILQALCQAGLGKGILAEHFAKVHLDGILQNDVMLICDQDVMNESKCASLPGQHKLVAELSCAHEISNIVCIVIACAHESSTFQFVAGCRQSKLCCH